MSHSTVYDRACTDSEVIERACRRLGVEFLGRGEHKLFDRSHVGVGIKFRDWSYPIVFNERGQAILDDYNGSWGDLTDLDRFCQAYAGEAVQKAYGSDPRVKSIQETALPNGETEIRVIMKDAEFAKGGEVLFAESNRH